MRLPAIARLIVESETAASLASFSADIPFSVIVRLIMVLPLFSHLWSIASVKHCQVHVKW